MVKTGAGSERDPEAWREGFCRRSDAGKTVDAVAARLPAVVDDEQARLPRGWRSASPCSNEYTRKN